MWQTSHILVIHDSAYAPSCFMYVTRPATDMGAGVAPEWVMPGEQLQETYLLGLQWARSLLMPCWR